MSLSKAKPLSCINVHINEQLFCFYLDHYNPCLESSFSVASDFDTAAKIETLITGTMVDTCLAASEICYESREMCNI